MLKLLAPNDSLEQNTYANDVSKQVIKVYFFEKILVDVDSYGSLPVTYLPFVYVYTSPFKCPHHPS